MAEAERVVTLPTVLQDAFARAWLRSRNNVTAYRAAGYKWEGMTQNTLAVEACRVRNSPKVSLIILDLLQEQAEHANLTPEWVIDQLMMEAKYAEGDGARATNLKTLAQSLAMLVQKNINENETKSDAEAILELVSADYAQAPKDATELKTEDMKLYKALMGKLGN